jgi:hypothetical protein
MLSLDSRGLKLVRARASTTGHLFLAGHEGDQVSMPEAARLIH